MNRADRKEYFKAYHQAHKEEHKAYHQAHKEEHKAYQKAYREAHKEERNAYQKAYQKAYREAHREEYNDYQKAYIKIYNKSDTNSQGKTKSSIRCMSSYYLFKTLSHNKVKGYEIHHCFGYDDYRNFIYIPKELHLKIHQYLRDNGIDADSDHYSKIEHLIVNYLKFNERHVLIMNGEED